MNCKALENPEILKYELDKNDDRILNQIKNCFCKLYLEDFKNFAFKRILHNCAIEDSDKKGLINYSFALGLEIFLELIIKNGFTAGAATLKTYFFEICKLQLLSNSRKPCSEKIILKNDDVIREFYNDDDDIEEKWKKQFDLYEKGMLLLDERCRMLIEVRKLNKFKKAVLVKKINIAEDTIDNTVSRCFKKLKAIINELKSKSV